MTTTTIVLTLIFLFIVIPFLVGLLIAGGSMECPKP